jgi:hypothetical protein
MAWTDGPAYACAGTCDHGPVITLVLVTLVLLAAGRPEFDGSGRGWSRRVAGWRPCSC